MRKEKSAFENIDWSLVILYFALVIMGWLNIYAAVYNDAFQSITDFTQLYGKQFIWIMAALLLILLIILVDGRLFESLAFILYGVGILSLIAVLIGGMELNGARSWFSFGSFTIQPSEFAKMTTLMGLAKWLTLKGIDLTTLKHQAYGFLLIGIPGLLVLMQPDAGSALVFFMMFLVLFRYGLPSFYLYFGGAAVVIFVATLYLGTVWMYSIVGGLMGLLALRYIRQMQKVIVAILLGGVALAYTFSVQFAFDRVLEDRHRNRINILLGKIEDPQGVGYNTEQSLIAIGSGGWTGKGYLRGTQTKFDFVPEQSTDFIFCTVGEEWGFMGSTAVVLLFVALIIRLVWVAERQRNLFSQVMGYGLAVVLFTHFTVNIGMALGLLPVIGIPLPFFSYGGSALWGFTLTYFIFVKLDAYRMQVLR
jgi:rod shape determining protein RodA